MFLNEISIKNYKSIKSELRLNNLGRLHFFIGANNAGKTNILDAISQIYLPAENRISDQNISLSAVFTLNKSKFEIKQDKNYLNFKLDNLILPKRKGIALLNTHIKRICATNPQDRTLVEKDFNDLINKFPKEYNKFYVALKKHIPKIKLSKSLFKDGKISEDGAKRDFDRLGHGFQQVFTILLYFFHPTFTILLLEEPEIHLHPALVKRLLFVLENMNIGTQVFITTHSPIFIHTTNLHRLFKVNKIKGTTKVFSPRLTGVKLNYTRLRQELNADNCEMFFADKVLLVEGPTDQILMRGLIEKFYSGGKNIKVIQTFGKSNMDIYGDLLAVFEIPYIVLLDRDALYDIGIKVIQKRIKQRFAKSERELIQTLKKYNVFVLPNGSIEKNYPKKYQIHRKRKPQNAMYAISHITKRDFDSANMANLKEVIDVL